MEIEKLIEFTRQQGEEVWVAGGANEDSIQTVEEIIGVKFPKSYRQFLRTFGGIFWGGNAISGIINNEPLAMEGGGIYADTMFMREDFNDDELQVLQHLWVLEKHEDGAYCFNFNIKTTGDEFGIINYEPHLPASTHSEVLASSFSEFITKWFFHFET